MMPLIPDRIRHIDATPAAITAGIAASKNHFSGLVQKQEAFQHNRLSAVAMSSSVAERHDKRGGTG